VGAWFINQRIKLAEVVTSYNSIQGFEKTVLTMMKTQTHDQGKSFNVLETYKFDSHVIPASLPPDYAVRNN